MYLSWMARGRRMQVRRERVEKPASKAARARAAEAAKLAAAQGLTVRQALAREALIHSEAQAAGTRSTSTMRAWLRHKGVGQPESHTKQNPPGKQQQRYATGSVQAENMHCLQLVMARSEVLCRIPTVTMHRVLLSYITSEREGTRSSPHHCSSQQDAGNWARLQPNERGRVVHHSGHGRRE